MQKTIQAVHANEPKPGKFGPVVWIDVMFDDGSRGSLGAKPTTAAERVAELNKLIGIPTEFEVTDGGEWNGQQQWRIKNYPGKPVSTGSGGGGGGGFRDEHIAILAAFMLPKDFGLADVVERITLARDHILPALRGEEAAGGRPTSAPAATGEVPLAASASLAQLKLLRKLAAEIGYSEEELLYHANVEKLSDLPAQDARDLITTFAGEIKERALADAVEEGGDQT